MLPPSTPSADPRARRRAPLAALVIGLVLLVGGLGFVAGLAVGGRSTAAEPDRSTASTAPARPPGTATPAPTPEPTPDLQTVTCTEPSEDFASFCEAFRRIKADYVDEVDDETLVQGALDGMVEALPDPYSGYLPAEQYRRALTDLSGEFSGIGAEVGIEHLEDRERTPECSVITNVCAVVIIAPLDGSPAEQAGLRSGDVVLEVDGEPTAGQTLDELVTQVRGEPGTDVTLTVRRGERELEIDLQEVEFEMLEDGVGYVRLAIFGEEAVPGVQEALQTLLADGAQSIVFDLRDNPGGFINAAQGVASQFLADGLLFTVEHGDSVQEWRTTGDGVATDPSLPLIMLVNRGTASASEIVAASLSEAGRARVVGERTFGKNTVQVWTELPDGGGLRLTTDRWFTPEHRSVAPDGLAPDVAVELPEELAADEDPVLDRALELLSGG
jgi:carboxyl-terminal processing protease